MEEGRLLKHRIGYGPLLEALGRFCDQEKLDEITLLEFEKGFVLQGLKVESTSEGYIRRIVTHTWSYEEVAGMVKPQEEDETPEQQKRRR